MARHVGLMCCMLTCVVLVAFRTLVPRAAFVRGPTRVPQQRAAPLLAFPRANPGGEAERLRVQRAELALAQPAPKVPAVKAEGGAEEEEEDDDDELPEPNPLLAYAIIAAFIVGLGGPILAYLLLMLGAWTPGT
mmetsp:Transcript_19810/g.54499  ORF Transcript_19810/g.54499 Transcript_19810/m.54499 type:complete len:134 (-) Transcript_19810:195-596(-)